MYLIFDAETTGFPKNQSLPPDTSDNWPRIVQLAWQLHDIKGKLLAHNSLIVCPDGFEIPFAAENVHGISTVLAKEKGKPLTTVLEAFDKAVSKSRYAVGHNIRAFDMKVILSEYLRLQKETVLSKHTTLDTMVDAGSRGKWEKLRELHERLFNEPLDNAHDAVFDVAATARCFFALVAQGKWKKEHAIDRENIHYEAPSLGRAASVFKKKIKPVSHVARDTAEPVIKKAVPFCHLRVHSQHALLPSTMRVEDIVEFAKKCKMSAVALTDLGNMFGAFKFVRAAKKAGIKPIVGCEFYLSRRRKEHKFTREDPDKRWQQILLAKNTQGYKQLCKLSTLGYTEGLYGIYPRIDKALIQAHKQDLIALSGNMHGELAHTILHEGASKAEEVVKWWQGVFGEDFYLEILPHGTEEEIYVRKILLDFAKRYHLQVVATSDVFYGKKEDVKTHETLLKIKTMGLHTSGFMGRSTMRLEKDSHYFRTQEDMQRCFTELPEALQNTLAVADKVADYQIEQAVILPHCEIPASFDSQDNYLKHLTFEGAKKRYTTYTPAIKERLDYELAVIKKMHFAGYFIIIENIVNEARRRGIFVGPGRGSAAGSLVVYCLGITNIDPIQYGLLFERFLNPDRISLPDIDVDFDDERRDELIAWIQNTYGKEHVAQIVTYHTMGARLAIRDCARVLDLPLTEANRLANMVPKRVGCTIAQAYKENPKLQAVKEKGGVAAEVLLQAEKLEGIVRNVGTHACGLIISPTKLQEMVPLMVSKETQFLVTQYDNNTVESVGLLKMDILGLRTLSILRRALFMIEQNHGKKIDLDKLPLDDAATYVLYQRGETHAIFQFESHGMQRYLKELQPDCFDDLIAMTSLYRPGPMGHIPSFIARKHGRERITYDLPIMQKYLKETYGITIYQEQVMLLAQELADFTRGMADNLRKAMGKKQKNLLDELRVAFEEGCYKKQHNLTVCKKIWKQWEAFTSYAFNKSHAASYALISYQSAYLKTHYPTEFMAATLSGSLHQTDKMARLVEECKSMGIEVLLPDINKANIHFSAQKEKKILFALAGIKGIGEAVAAQIVAAREKEGAFSNVFDFVHRMENLEVSGHGLPHNKERSTPRGLGKSTYELLVKAGSFDVFPNSHRRAYIAPEKNSLIDLAIQRARHSAKKRENRQPDLFGRERRPSLPQEGEVLTPYSKKEMAVMEKERLGVYLSSHPITPYLPLIACCNIGKLSLLEAPNHPQNKFIRLQGVGLIARVEHKKNKQGGAYSILTLEDASGSFSYRLWGDVHQSFHEHYAKKPMSATWYIAGSMAFSRFKDDMEFKVEEVLPFPVFLSRYTEGIEIGINPKHLNHSMLGSIETLFAEHEGHYPLHIRLTEADTTLTLSNKKRGITMGEVFINALMGIQNISISLHTRGVAGVGGGLPYGSGSS